jgi:hypothetical protein
MLLEGHGSNAAHDSLLVTEAGLFAGSLDDTVGLWPPVELSHAPHLSSYCSRILPAIVLSRHCHFQGNHRPTVQEGDLNDPSDKTPDSG